MSHAYAATDVFTLQDIFEPLKGMDIASAYAKYPYLVDSIIYFLFFLGVAQLTLAKKFEGRGGKLVIIAFGIALSYAMAYWAAKKGFMLGSLGPLAAIILSIVMAIMIWRMFTHENKAESFWIGFVAVWVGMHMFMPQVIKAIRENKYGALVYGILGMIFIIAIVMMIYGFFKGKPSTEGGQEPESPGSIGLADRFPSGVAPGATPHTTGAEADELKKLLKQLEGTKKAEEDAKKATKETEDLKEKIKGINDDNLESVDITKGTYEIIRQLANYLSKFPHDTVLTDKYKDYVKKVIDAVIKKIQDKEEIKTGSKIKDLEESSDKLRERIARILNKESSDATIDTILEQLQSEGAQIFTENKLTIGQLKENYQSIERIINKLLSDLESIKNGLNTNNVLQVIRQLSTILEMIERIYQIENANLFIIDKFENNMRILDGFIVNMHNTLKAKETVEEQKVVQKTADVGTKKMAPGKKPARGQKTKVANALKDEITRLVTVCILYNKSGIPREIMMPPKTIGIIELLASKEVSDRLKSDLLAKLAEIQEITQLDLGKFVIEFKVLEHIKRLREEIKASVSRMYTLLS